MKAGETGSRVPADAWLQPADIWQAADDDAASVDDGQGCAALLACMFVGALWGAACALWFLS